MRFRVTGTMKYSHIENHKPGKGGVTKPEALSYSDIQQGYEGEWILIAYESLDENLKPIAEEVIAHATDRDEAYAALSSLLSLRVAVGDSVR